MIISLKNFTHDYVRGRRALDVSGFNVNSGEKVALVGRNGSGKTTLLHALAGLLDTSSGARSCTVPAEQTALVFQSVCLDKKLTVKENLHLFGKVWGLSGKQLDSQLSKTCATLNLTSLLDRAVGSLSGGQQRRADLARALLCDPDVLFLDEPTNGLDVFAQREFWMALENAKEQSQRLTLVCASHHGSELSLFDRIVFLDSGRVRLDVSRAQLFQETSPETIEISTLHAHDLQKALAAELKIDAYALPDQKIMSQTNDATDTLLRMKAIPGFERMADSITVRRTVLADIILKKLSGFSADGGDAERHGGVAAEGVS